MFATIDEMKTVLPEGHTKKCMSEVLQRLENALAQVYIIIFEGDYFEVEKKYILTNK